MISWTLDGAIATLTLDRPRHANAIPIAGWHALAAAAAEIAESDARAVVMRAGSAGIFSAGADIGEFAALRADPTRRAGFREAMRAGIDALAALPMPVIAAVDGGCFGAAVALVLACDLRVAGNDAHFATTPAKLGLGYPREDVARLVAQVGRGQASRMLLAADRIDADEAWRIGLVALRAANAGEAAQALAARIAGHGPDAVRLLKRTIADPATPGLDEAFDAAFGGDELARGLAAFADRAR